MNLFDDINLNIPRMEQQRYEKIKKSGKYMELNVLIGSDDEDLGEGFIAKTPVVRTTIKGVGPKEVGCMYMTLNELVKSLEKEFPSECFVAKLSMRAEHDGAVSIENLKSRRTKMRTKLYDYQDKTAKDIFDRMSNTDQRGAYLGFDTGTGKTVTSLSVAEKLYKNHMIKGVVVICPVSKVDDWKRDLEYEVPEIEMKFVSSFQSAWREKNKAKIEYVCKMVDALVIVDEGHKMKTYDSKQSKFIQALSETYKPYMLVLSATPQNKKYIDLYPQYKALGHPLFNIKPKDFKQRFCIEAQNWNLVRAGKARFPFNEIVGYRETEKMDEAVNDYTYYKKYESEYDRPIEIPQLFKMTSEMKYFKEKKVWPKMDEKALEEALAIGDIESIDTDFIIANRPTLFHIYARESCSGFIKDKFLKDNPKLQWLEDFLDGNEGRIVVFTNFINETYIIKALCDKLKRHCVIYDGAHKDLKDWYEQDDCVAVVNVVAGGAGINDFAKTNIAIFFSPPENHIDFEQAKGRIDRIGQTKQPVYYYLQIMNSVEPAIYRNLKEGQDFDERMFEEWLEKGE